MKTLTFPGSYSSLVKIGEFVTQAAKSIGFDGFELYKIETAVDEACSNIIEHAYGQENIGDIVVSVVTDLEKITITLTDFGEPFDPKYVKQPDLDADLEVREDHGLGIYMMKQWMDVVIFDTNQEKNVLTLVKYLKD
ncbi:MAG: ATP-binding protein [Chloroflexi bacterium HGW-Chloroflexi-2]|jgi:serine/threonine-protein kinase RsbW|nr:MAG: ATP-binding protein [Chloroflexi bacterium HGW-Chloroflexi-2]